MEKQIRIPQYPEDLYVTDAGHQIELQVHDTAITIDKDNVPELIAALEKLTG